MAAGMQFVVSGDLVGARDFVLGVFQQHQWRVSLKGDWEAKAEHGSKGGSFWGGAFVGKKGRYVQLTITVSSDPQGNAVVNLIEGSSGFSGGVIGITQAKEVYQSMYDAVGLALTNAGKFVANFKI